MTIQHNRARVTAMLPFMKLWAEGKTLQYKPSDGKWYIWEGALPPPVLSTFEWRVKPEARVLYRIEHEDGRMYSSTFNEQEAKDIVYRTGQQNHTRHLKLTIVPYLEQPHG